MNRLFIIALAARAVHSYGGAPSSGGAPRAASLMHFDAAPSSGGAARAASSAHKHYGAPPFGRDPSAPPRFPTLPNVTLGPVEIIVDWPTMHCACNASDGCTDPHDPDYADTPPRAFVDAAGAARLFSSDAQSRQTVRANASDASGAWVHECTVYAASQFDCRPPSYNFQTWLHSPFILDNGLDGFALVHMECAFDAPRPARVRCTRNCAP